MVRRKPPLADCNKFGEMCMCRWGRSEPLAGAVGRCTRLARPGSGADWACRRAFRDASGLLWVGWRAAEVVTRLSQAVRNMVGRREIR